MFEYMIAWFAFALVHAHVSNSNTVTFPDIGYTSGLTTIFMKSCLAPCVSFNSYSQEEILFASI